MKRKSVLFGILTVVFIVMIGVGFFQGRRGQQQASASRQLFAMDTVMSLEASGKNAQEAVDAAVEEIHRLDALFSTGNENSEISILNRQGEGDVSEDTLAVIQEGLRLHEQTDGLFDMTVYPLMELWGFTDQQYHVPGREELEEVLPLVDASRIEVSGRHVTLGEGQQIDLGGIAKGFTSQRMMEIYEDYGIESGLVSLGGNIQVLGTRPDGSKWNIGIRNPWEEQEEALAGVRVRDRAVITSGGYERYFEEDGNTYIHILDPKTGYPADGDLVSVSVISGDGMLADALSTSLYLMGLEKACDYWEEHYGEFDMVLIAEDGGIYITEGIEEDFSAQGKFEVLIPMRATEHETPE